MCPAHNIRLVSILQTKQVSVPISYLRSFILLPSTIFHSPSLHYLSFSLPPLSFILLPSTIFHSPSLHYLSFSFPPLSFILLPSTIFHSPSLHYLYTGYSPNLVILPKRCVPIPYTNRDYTFPAGLMNMHTSC